jgi:hypothetical protein
MTENVASISLSEFLQSTPIGVTKTIEATETFDEPPGTVLLKRKPPDAIYEYLPRIRLFCDGER